MWPFRKRAEPSIASAARALATLRHERARKAERARYTSLHDTMAAQLGRDPIQWRKA